MKSKTKAPMPVTTSVRRVPTHVEISSHARLIWERRGYPENQDTDIWLEAERQLCTGTGPVAARKPSITEAAGPLGELGEPEESIEERLEGFGNPPANRSATSL
jgi:hypothetical protein